MPRPRPRSSITTDVSPYRDDCGAVANRPAVVSAGDDSEPVPGGPVVT